MFLSLALKFLPKVIRFERFSKQLLLNNLHGIQKRCIRSRSEKPFLLKGFLLMWSIPWLFWKSENDINKKPFYKEIVKLIKYAKYKQHLKEFKESEETYQHALNLIYSHTKTPGADEFEISQAKSYVLDAMADVAFVENNLNKAFKLYVETMNELINVQHVSPDDNSILEISLKLAMIYAAQGKTDMAEIGYKYCLEILNNKTSDNDEIDKNTLALYGMSLDSYARYLFRQNKFVESLSYQEKSLIIAKEVFDDDGPQLSVLYNDLGVILTQLKELDQALVYFKLSLLSADETNLSIIYFNMGEVYFLQNKFESAEIEYENAIKHSDQSSSPNIKTEILNSKLRMQNKTTYNFGSKFFNNPA